MAEPTRPPHARPGGARASASAPRSGRKVPASPARRWFVLFAVLVIVIAIGASFASGGRSYGGPRCAPHSSRCSESSNGNWIPRWYYVSLQRAQHRSPPSTTGSQPSIAQEEAAGATPHEADQARTAAQSGSSG